MRTKLVLLRVALACPVLFSSCIPPSWSGDWTMFIHNETSQTWYLRVDTGDPTLSGLKFVVQVRPGADGPAIDWRGAREATVDVLRLDCTTAGFLKTTDGTIHVVDGVPGLSGHVERFSGIRSSTSEIQYTMDCGGFMFA